MRSLASVSTPPHSTALQSICSKMRWRGTPSSVAITVPPMGDSKIGVKKAMPPIPNRRNILMILRERLEKMGARRRRRCRCRWRTQARPTPENTKTLVIMPATVRLIVGQKLRPRLLPASGPPKNLTVLSRKTEAHLAA